MDLSTSFLLHAKCRRNCRFTVPEIQQLVQAFRLPGFIRTRERYTICSVEALSMVLTRLAYPTRQEPTLAEMYGRSGSAVSAIVNHVCALIYSRFSEMIMFDEQYVAENAVRFAEAITSKCGGMLDCIFGWIDGTKRKVAKPSKCQRVMYSGHKRVHCLKYQGILCPSGIIVSMFGPVEGRRHDLFLLNISVVGHRIRTLEALNGLYLYGDSGYVYNDIIITPFKGSHLSVAEEDFNEAMSACRVSVEHSFGRVVNLFGFLDYSRTQRVLQSAVALHYLVATLLTNCRTCLDGGNQTSMRFEVAPPTLSAYLSRAFD